MKLHHTLLAAALVALSAPAMAFDDDADIYANWNFLNSIYVIGDIDVVGRIRVSGESGALVDQDQFTYSNDSYGDGDNSASASGNALRGATGNIGVNIASGVGNAQANDGALSSIDGGGGGGGGGGCGPGDTCTPDSLDSLSHDDDVRSRGNVFASAMVFNSQTTESNFGTDAPSGPDAQLFYTATVTDNVLAGASGNIGLNVAAGAGNAQSNGLAASVNSSGTIAKASADSEQLTLFNGAVARRDLDNTAVLNGNALSSAVGNIGVNIAAGVGNAQHNGLAIAVASCGTCD